MKTILCAVLLCYVAAAAAAEPVPEERRLANLALGKYKQNVASAQRAYEKALADAQAELDHDYGKAIKDAMRRGSDGLELANQLLAEKNSTTPEKVSSELFAPSRNDVLMMLRGHVFLEKFSTTNPRKFVVGTDGAVIEKNESGTSYRWYLEPRLVLVGNGHVLIHIDRKHFCGVHIADDKSFDLYSQ